MNASEFQTPSLSRHQHQQSPGPETKRRSRSGQENEPGIRGQLRPFRDDAPDMRDDDQAEDGAGGHQISLHGIAFQSETCRQNVPVGLTIPDRLRASASECPDSWVKTSIIRRVRRSRRGWRHQRRKRALPIFVLLLVQGGATHAQTAAPPRDSRAPDLPAGTAIIRGRVVSAASDAAAPIRDARVSISAPVGAVDPVFTDGAGRFEFRGLPTGRYTLTAEKTGFVKTRYGSKNDLDPPVPVDVGDASVLDAIEIRQPKGAAIVGRIVDELGEPVVGASVSVGFLRATGTGTRFVGVERPGSDTDDRGEYRVGGLPAGRYYVTVAGSSEGSPIPGAPMEWARTVGWGRTFYFASSSLAGATPILLGAGEERTGVDFVLVPSRPAKLTLSLTDAAGGPATGMINLLLPGDAPGSILANRGVPMSPANPRMTSTLDPGEWIAVALGNAKSTRRP